MSPPKRDRTSCGADRGGATSPRKAARRSAGFALLIVITLIAFVVVLLIGLATYTRVETAIAGNTQRQEQARANALLGLNVALGQLQKYAGPDQRVTATADAFNGHSGTTHYTGVWTSNPADANSTSATPLTWLVSGNEPLSADGTVANALAFTPESTTTGTNFTALVSSNTTGTANDVQARLMPIATTGVPGATAGASITIGRYAWWVGDQGVKAPVAVPDASSSVTYTPWVFANSAGGNSTDTRTRIRQQISLGAGAVDTTKSPASIVLEPRDANSSTLVSSLKVVAPNQLAFLKAATQDGTAAASSAAIVGPALVRQNFHNWAPNNFAVLANTKLGGLRQDLSLFSPATPSPLGAGYDAWADYTSYMEDPAADVVAPTPAISPAYGSDPLRRRYRIQRPASVDGAAPGAAPILTYFLLTFNVGTNGSTATNAPLMVRARWMVSLWNPYSSALVPPQKLRLEVTNLPRLGVDDTAPPESRVASIDLDSLYGTPLTIELPWDATSSTAADCQSWLPGRVYSWTALENLTGVAPSADGFASKFYSRNLTADAGQGVQQTLAGVTVDGSRDSEVHGSATTLTVTLYADGVKIGTFLSPAYSGFTAVGPQFQSKNYQFSYVFRLAEPIDGAAWIARGPDIRTDTLDSAAFVALPNGTQPEQYVDFTTISIPDRLLDRASGELTFDSDVPVFELPRSPILSLGELQHLQLVGQRPFAVGNSWGTSAQLGTANVSELFDRFFYSGLVASATPPVDASGNWVSSNPLQVRLRRGDGTKPTPNDLQTEPNALSSKYILQGGAFNLNSTSPAAWAAVLRSVRFPAPQSFSYLNASFGSGTGSDGSKLTVQSADAQFFRFAQSAQETYETDAPGNATDAGGNSIASTYAASTDAPPNPPNVVSNAHTELYRRGMKTLTAAQVTTLATNIANAVKAHQAVSGPFRSLEEFLAPLSGGPSLIEQAILDADTAGAQINTDAAGTALEFSSQYLTQADILTALAPVLFPRSDTFIIRAYGEAVNPATALTEGRAWCEATVQRVPDYFDPARLQDPTDPTSSIGDDATVAPAALTSQLNQLYGRRFKIVAFRWLTRSDI